MSRLTGRMRKLRPEIERTAQTLGINPNWIRAAIQVESGAERRQWRFEAHKFPLDAKTYTEASDLDLEEANSATSHGLFQIMGFHAESLGYDSATDMRRKFFNATSGVEEQFAAWVRFVRNDPRLLAAARSGDALSWALAYAGPAQARYDYSSKFTEALTKWDGQGPTVVLHPGARGHLVWDLQVALQDNGFDGVSLNSHFDAETEVAVRAFQSANDLTVDGVVGEKTAAALGLNLRAPRPAWYVRLGRWVWATLALVAGAVWNFLSAMIDAAGAAISWLASQGMSFWHMLVKLASDLPSTVWMAAGGVLIVLVAIVAASRSGYAVQLQRPARASRLVAQVAQPAQHSAPEPAPPQPPRRRPARPVRPTYDDGFPPDEQPAVPTRPSPPPAARQIVTTSS